MCESDTVQYLRDLIQEKEFLNKIEGHNIIKSLLEQEISRLQCGGRPPGIETPYVDIYNEKPVRVSTKVLVPVKQHPKFNFVGKLLGPRGSSLKQLQSISMTKMAILGRGSMRNQAQEEELRSSSDPKHSHLGEDLHVEISTFASPSEAHARLAFALSEVRAYMIPDSNDQIRQQQMRDIKMIKMLASSSSSTPEAEGSTVAEDSGHDSDVSNSPTPRESNDVCSTQVTPATCKSVNTKSIFDKIFNNQVVGGNQDRKRPGFLKDIYSNGTNSNNGEEFCKRFKP